MIKNVIVLNDYDYVQGGASLVAIENANLLYEEGYNVTFFCGVSNKEKSILNKNIEVISVDKYDSLSNPSKIKGMLQGVNNKRASKAMDELLSKLDSAETVVFIHGYTKSLSTSFVKKCRKYKVKTILTAHDYFSVCANGGLFNYKKNFICEKQGKFSCFFCNCDSRNYVFKMYRNLRMFYQNKISKFRKNIDYVITISERNSKLLENKFSNAKYVRIYNPTSIEKQEERVVAEGNSSYIYVGRIDPEKGIDLMCDAFKSTNQKLKLLGSGTAYEDLKSRYESRNIEFLGWVNHDIVINEMKKAKGLIFPSLLYEGAPLTIFEAQSQGIPCIVSKYSNGSDFINDKNGWTYDPFDTSLKTLLVEISNCDIKEKSIYSYQEYWKNPYDKNRYVKNLKELLNEIKV